MKAIILGGGIAGLSMAYFLKKPSIILEKDLTLGGLCRSFCLNGIYYDIGPHIIFSKNEEVLNFHLSLLETTQLRRSNKIFYKGRFIKYPFENDLGALDSEERDYCLKEFLDNPYEEYEAATMQQFFLKTFGEGITRLYLQPYNEKIWKFDPGYMDMQMVERIPKPPKEDVVKSAKGVPTEGYMHQLYFHYPNEGGFQQLITSYEQKLKNKTEIIKGTTIKKITRRVKLWEIETDKGIFLGDTLINCMPLHELFGYLEVPDKVRKTLSELKYNSMYILILQVQKDALGDNFAVYFPDNTILFHRVSKLNFLGKNYCLKDGGSTLLVEITYRPGSYLSQRSVESIKEQVIRDLTRVGIISRNDLLAIDIKNIRYAYVIYDLNHRVNTDIVLNYLSSLDISCCGRFAEFEYMNSDKVVERSIALAKRLDEESQ